MAAEQVMVLNEPSSCSGRHSCKCSMSVKGPAGRGRLGQQHTDKAAEVGNRQNLFHCLSCVAPLDQVRTRCSWRW
jgi:hypothetical protein